MVEKQGKSMGVRLKSSIDGANVLGPGPGQYN